MATTFSDSIKEYQQKAFRLDPPASIKNFDQAVDFINERGVVLFWPVKGIFFPSLWTAVAGDRPVPNEHDDPAHITWRWKDSALGNRVWYYAKILRYKSTFISLGVLPYFYALSDNYGSPKEDYLLAYQDGHLTLTEKLIYEAILNNGPMHTIDLRQTVHLSVKNNDNLFNRAMEKLQAGFRLVPVGIAEAGTWNYAFIYDLTTNHFPGLVEEARGVGEMEARKKLVEIYFLSLGASDDKNLKKLYRWDGEIVNRVLDSLVSDGFLVKSPVRVTTDSNWYSLPFLAQ